MTMYKFLLAVLIITGSVAFYVADRGDWEP